MRVRFSKIIRRKSYLFQRNRPGDLESLN